MRWKEEMRQNEQNRNAANILGAALKRKKKKIQLDLKELKIRMNN